MLHREVLLTVHDLLSSLRAVCYNKVSAEINTFFIVKAIRTAYLGPVNATFARSDVLYPVILTVELLEPRITNSKTLSLILFNEGTLDSAYEVTENIYKH